MNCKLYLKKVNKNWRIKHFKLEDLNGVLQYVGTQKLTYDFNKKSSISEEYLDINENFYSNYMKLVDAWYTKQYSFRPIQFWIHEYVRFGTAFKLKFSEYYELVLKLYTNLPMDLPQQVDEIYILYDKFYNIQNVETKLYR